MARTKEEIWKCKEEDAGRGMDEGRGGRGKRTERDMGKGREEGVGRRRRKDMGKGRDGVSVREGEEEWTREEGGRGQDSRRGCVRVNVNGT